MATPALRLLRTALKGAFIGALARPGIDDLLAGSDLVDELHVERARGVMGPKHAAAKVRARRYDTALLLTNSFSSALITRLAWIPRRIGYDRDARGLLLTDRIKPLRRAAPHRGWLPVPAVEYYLRAARAMLGLAEDGSEDVASSSAGGGGGAGARLELGITPAQDGAAREILRRAGLKGGVRFAILNPGGNNPAKRWPAERFAAVGRHLIERHGMGIAINGSPEEADLGAQIAAMIGPLPAHPAASLPALGVTIGSLKGIIRRAALMVTNDTGPRHIAAAFGVPTVALFGPTDPRWTALPAGQHREVVIVADPTLPADEVADDHPERCRIDRIEVGAVVGGVEGVIEVGRG